MEESKPFWKSKTLWANVLALVVSAANQQAGWLQVSGDETAAALVILNLIMRAVTKGKVTLK